MSTTATEMAPQTKERLKILVVEDEPVVRLAIRMILEKDYDILEAESISESLTLFDLKKPDLITLDLYLPDVEGMQGLQKFRQRSEKIPIILLSGHASFKLAQEALRLGATDYLTKPFTPKDLLETVQSVITRTKARDQSDLDLSVDATHALKLRLPLENLQEDKFLSPRHRSHFLAFAQNALSEKKRKLETVAVQELFKTISQQFTALHLHDALDSKANPLDPKLLIECDMYLLGGAMANLVFACMLETKNDSSPFTLGFDSSGEKLRMFYQKGTIHLPEDILVRFKHWHENPTTAVDANTAMLILAENVVKQHHGEFILNALSSSGPLVEIQLPLKEPATPKPILVP